MNIKTLLIETTNWWKDSLMPHGFGNGYIGVPPEHPWYGKHYDDIDCNVHGGLTYAADSAPTQEPDGYWWIGFDTAHLFDNKNNCPKEYCEQQIESMKEQALKVVL